MILPDTVKVLVALGAAEISLVKNSPLTNTATGLFTVPNTVNVTVLPSVP